MGRPPPFERSPSCGLVLPYWWLAGGLGEREKEIEAGVTVNGDNGCLGVRDGEDLTQALSADGVTVVLTYRLRLSWLAHFVLFVEHSFGEFAARRSSMVKLLRACCGNIRAGCRVSPTLCVSCSRVYSDCLQGT